MAPRRRRFPSVKFPTASAAAAAAAQAAREAAEGVAQAASEARKGPQDQFAGDVPNPFTNEDGSPKNPRRRRRGVTR